MKLDRIGRAVALAAAIAACTAATPPPSPERAPYPILPFPSCTASHECAPGEDCRDGLCWPRDGEDAGVAAVQPCPQGCRADEICITGTCVAGGAVVDAGAPGAPADACGGCPAGLACDRTTGMCKSPGSEIPD